MRLELKNWLKLQDKLWLSGYIATLLIPLGLIFNRGVTEVCVVIIGTLFLIDSFRQKKWGWLREPVIIIGIIAWTWLLLISIFAQNTTDSLSVAIPWIRYLLLYAALQSWILIRSENIYSLGKFLALMLCFVIIDTFWQYIFGTSLTGHIRDESGRLTGPMNNLKVGIFMAKTLFPTIGICLFFTSLNKQITKIIFYASLLIISIITILLSGERTAFSSVIIAVLAISSFLAIYEPKLRKFVFIGIAVILSLAVALFQTQSWVKIRTNQFYDTISTYPTTEYGQLEKGGIIIGADNIITGAGLKGFRSLCPSLLANEQVTTCNLHPHNLYIEWFAESGIIGLLLFTSMVFYWFFTITKNFIKQRGIEKLLPVFALACLIVNLFPFMPTQSIFSNWPAILLWYSISVSIASINALEITNHKNS